MKLETFDSSEDVFRALTEKLIAAIEGNGSQPFHLALSGGETAQLMFKVWESEYREKLPWHMVRFYWVDERCVAPDDEQSNFKYAEELLFRPLDIPIEHIHRLHGEREPEQEAMYYSELVKWELPGHSDMPRFNCIILGIGSECHTASIFPASSYLLTDERCYAVSEHPVTKQKRVTMTGTLILKGRMILVPVVGFAKTDCLRSVLKHTPEGHTPAGYILSKASDATVLTNCKLD